MQHLQSIKIRLPRGPADAQPLGVVGFRDHVEMHVVDLLVGDAPVVLQHVVVDGAAGGRELLDHGQDLRQSVVRDVGKFGTVVFGDDELEKIGILIRFGWR